MKCVDLGTEYCPCTLALTGDCLICSRLQTNQVFGGGSDWVFDRGEDCDCEWSGSCPYTVMAQNGGTVSERRREVLAKLVERKDYADGVSVLVFDVGRGFAQKASLPGSFVFLRRGKCDDEFCSAPISLLRADENEGTIHLAIRKEGPKSKLLLNSILPIDDGYKGDDGEALKTVDSYWIRGPYRSGLLGADVLRPVYARGKKILVLSKGIGAAPALLMINRLMTMEEKAAPKIRWLADDTKIDRALIEDYDGRPEYMALTSPPGPAEPGARRAQGGLPEEIKEEGYEIVVVTGSPHFVETMSREVKGLLPEATLVISNNATMCCGEGLCGACTEVTKDGRVIRWCKCK